MKRLFASLCLLAAASAWAGVRQATELTIPAGERISEDLYLAGGTVAVEGVVDGDLVVAAGELRLTGEVTGDLLFIGGRAKLLGPVRGSVRGVGAQLAIEGLVEDDVAFAGGELTVGRFGAVERDLLLAVGSAVMRGEVWRDVRALAGGLTVDGFVGAGVQGQLGQLTLGEEARVFGGVKIASDSDVVREPGAQVVGRIATAPLPAELRGNAGLGFVGWLRSLVALLAVSALWLMLFPGFSRRAMATLRERTVESLGFGVLALLATPLLAVAVFATGVVVGGWWLSAVVLGAGVVAAAIAAPLVGHFVGEWLTKPLKRPRSEPLNQGVGLVVLTLLAAVPVLGVLVVFTTAAAGVGAQLLALRGRLPVQTSERLDTLRDELPEVPAETAVGSPS